MRCGMRLLVTEDTQTHILYVDKHGLEFAVYIDHHRSDIFTATFASKHCKSVIINEKGSKTQTKNEERGGGG